MKPFMNFGEALIALKAGRAIARSAWKGGTGRDAFLLLIPGSTFEVSEGRPMAAHFSPGTKVSYHGHIDMKTASGYVMPWTPTQADLLEEDWMVLS